MSTTDPGGAGSRVLRISGIKRPLQKRTQTDDWVRALLAVLLFGLLAAEIGCAMYVIITCSAPMHDKAIEHFKDVLTMVLSPTIALFGAATGFYYGTKSDGRGGQDR